MSTGSIRINESPKNEMVSDLKENAVECLLVHGMEDDSNDASGAFRLRRGEIAVIGCASSKSLPLFNLDERAHDIRLTSGEVATINSRNSLGEITDSIDVVCDLPVQRVATRDLRINQFVVISRNSSLMDIFERDASP
ncbi:MAG TPA: hypothetical protein VFK37_07385 [Bacillales bacterium]|nr:hypothetical protein [Bacillales bacterium]